MLQTVGPVEIHQYLPNRLGNGNRTLTTPIDINMNKVSDCGCLLVLVTKNTDLISDATGSNVSRTDAHLH